MRQTGPAAIATVFAGLAIGVALAAWQRGAANRPISHASPVAVSVATTIATAVPTTAVALPESDYSALQGAWQIDEAQFQIGRMVWSGHATISSGGAIVLDTHKVSVAGKPATRCERQTYLHTALVVGVSPQTVPFREVNCEGATLSGELRVSSFSRDGRSFRGSFWQGGLALGDFIATKQ